MACEAYREIIDRFVGNLATAEEKKDLEEHMKTCGECRSEVEDISRMLKAFNSFESVDLPDDLMPLLHERLLKICAESAEKEKNISVCNLMKRLTAILYNFYRINSKVLTAGICAALISFFLGRFSVMPASFKYGINTAVEYDKIQPDDGPGSAKRLMMAKSASQDEKDIKQDAPQEIQKGKQENIQNDTAAGASGDTAGRSAELTRSSRNGMMKEYASAKNATQYKVQQASGPKAAAATSITGQDGDACSVVVRVYDFDKKVVFTISLAHQLSGDIQKAEITADSEDNSRTAYIVMKIPVEREASALEQIKALGEVEKSYKASQAESAAQKNGTVIMHINIIEKNTAQAQSN
ncbi:MAG: hypothetical protein PWQ97_1511 [Tepidanaerobacteraceae bacterium]|nr:hypothetical protein [Tepidanaerobacteraceae bacterium]